MKKALIITWDGFQDQEVIYPYYRLQEAGFQVTISGATGKEEVIGLFGTKFKCIGDNMILSPENYDLLVLPGGVKALEKVRQSVPVLNFIKAWSKDKVISSICHGAQLLISCGKVKDEEVSGYYSIKDDIINAGGSYNPNPVISSNIVSGAHYKDMPEWMEKTLQTYDIYNERL